ncbi:MAG: hydrogenase maturation nickel metallochaperone HypA [Desulfuromonadaceae bacterium]|nr:hydrogenase maturation nickel metallochaperone HypA [Desulfuromonadaceae bacterium]MDD5106513.1 hydrogenase maturation nickel metallochaperone HypA [Desulfuromonadaceae bacterium]
MHEMSITQGIIDLCLEHADGHRISAVEIDIGELSSVVPESIEFCFEACSQETLLEGARLTITRIPGMGVCKDCSRETMLTELYGTCRHCNSNRVTIVTGEELRVRAIEID